MYLVSNSGTQVTDSVDHKFSAKKKQASLFFRAVLLSWIFIKLRGLLFNKIFSNYLDQEDFGSFNFLFQTATFIGSVSTLGLVNAIFRYTSVYSEQNNRKKIANLMITSFFVGFGIFILAFSGFIILSSLDADTYGKFGNLTTGLIGIFGFLLILQNLISGYVQVERRSIAYILLNVIIVYSNLILAVIFSLFMTVGVNELLIAYVISYGGFLGIYCIKFVLDNGLGTFSKEQFRLIIKFSAPSFLLTPFLNFFNFLQYYLLNISMGEEAIALFVISLSVAGFLNIVVNSASLSFRSLQFNLFDSNEHTKLKSLTNKVTRIYVASLIPIILLIWYNADLLIDLLSNSSYVSFETTFGTLILGMGYLFRVMLNTTCQSPYYYKETTKIALLYFIAVVVSGFLSVFLVSIYGILGVALAFTIHDFLRWIFVFPFSQKLYPTQYSGKKMTLLVIPTSLSVLVFFILLNFFTWNVIFVSIVSLLVYAIFLFGLRLVSFEEIKTLSQTLFRK